MFPVWESQIHSMVIGHFYAQRDAQFNEFWVQIHLLDLKQAVQCSHSFMQAMHYLLLLCFLSAELVASIFHSSRSITCQEIYSVLVL